MRARAQRGQAAVELALVLPCCRAGPRARPDRPRRAGPGAGHLRRQEGARQAAVEDDDAAVRRAVTASTRLGGDRLDIDVGDRGEPGSRVTVRVAYRAPTDLPLVGRLVGDVPPEGVATMRVER